MSETKKTAEVGRISAFGKLEEMTIEEVRQFQPEVAVFPLGSTEPHGPHLPYGTDTLIAGGGLARRCARLMPGELGYWSCRACRSETT